MRCSLHSPQPQRVLLAQRHDLCRLHREDWKSWYPSLWQCYWCFHSGQCDQVGRASLGPLRRCRETRHLNRQTQSRELPPPQPLSAEKPNDISSRGQEVRKRGLDHVWRNFVQIFRPDRKVSDVEQDGKNEDRVVIMERKNVTTETEGSSEDDVSQGRTEESA